MRIEFKSFQRGLRLLELVKTLHMQGIADEKRDIYAFQFHPEVHHTKEGTKLLKNFAKNICGCESTWNMGSFAKEKIADIQKQVGDKKVLCGVSGGVDSSVVATLLREALPKEQLSAYLLTMGYLEKMRLTMCRILFKLLDIPLITIDCKDEFLSGLKGVSDPESTRRQNTYSGETRFSTEGLWKGKGIVKP